VRIAPARIGTSVGLLVLGIAEEGWQVLSLSEEPDDVDVIVGRQAQYTMSRA
jgi:hypothetical protein